MKPVTKFDLLTALFTGGPLATTAATFKIVNAVAREDGSGHCFNVTGIDTAGRNVTAFVRTID